LLAQDDAGGLEIRDAQGEWCRAEVIPGTLVVNLGDCLAMWTNDLYKSTQHRVMNAISGRDRYSIAFFYSPSYYSRIECIPTCLAPGEKPKYEPFTYGEFAREQLLKTRRPFDATKE
jgi:isopenicillin N synthase-like dioxygenase